MTLVDIFLQEHIFGGSWIGILLDIVLFVLWQVTQKNHTQYVLWLSKWTDVNVLYNILLLLLYVFIWNTKSCKPSDEAKNDFQIWPLRSAF